MHISEPTRDHAGSVHRLQSDRDQFALAWADAECQLIEEDRQSEAARDLIRNMRQVSIAALIILALDLTYRAVVPGYSSPSWVPVLLSGGAITGHVTAIMAGVGRDGGSCRNIADVDLIVAGDSTARIQEAHKFLLHVLCEIVEPNLAK